MALNELVVSFETELTDIAAAREALESAKAIAAEANLAVNSKQDEVATQTTEARAAYNALLTELAAQAASAGII